MPALTRSNQTKHIMKIKTEKIKSNCWAWEVLQAGKSLAAGYCTTKHAAESDAQAWIESAQAAAARAAGWIVKGDKLDIKPEWQDPGDEDYDFYAIETQLGENHEIRMRAIDKLRIYPSIGAQSIKPAMLAK